ncbi:MAG: hypothetical protein LBG11_01455 [Bifidobacteriaceae bacterium]|nr:hypothetical protein [Bifidobacteriaceae bacterium]
MFGPRPRGMREAEPQPRRHQARAGHQRRQPGRRRRETALAAEEGATRCGKTRRDAAAAPSSPRSACAPVSQARVARSVNPAPHVLQLAAEQDQLRQMH